MFGKKENEEDKREREMQKFMDRYQLEDLDSKDLAVIKRIATDLAGSGFGKLGMALSFGKTEDKLKIGYLSALVEQNWMIIRQLSRLNKNIEKISER